MQFWPLTFLISDEYKSPNLPTLNSSGLSAIINIFGDFWDNCLKVVALRGDSLHDSVSTSRAKPLMADTALT